MSALFPSSQVNLAGDLSRYFSPHPDYSSVKVHTIEHSDPTGKLSQLTIDEPGLVKPRDRMSRVTNAIWRYEGGGLGSLLHGIALHGQRIILLLVELI